MAKPINSHCKDVARFFLSFFLCYYVLPFPSVILTRFFLSRIMMLLHCRFYRIIKIKYKFFFYVCWDEPKMHSRGKQMLSLPVGKIEKKERNTVSSFSNIFGNVGLQNKDVRIYFMVVYLSFLLWANNYFIISNLIIIHVFITLTRSLYRSL